MIGKKSYESTYSTSKGVGIQDVGFCKKHRSQNTGDIIRMIYILNLNLRSEQV